MLSPVTCRVCNKTSATGDKHAFCCAPGEGTRGHSDIRDEVFQVIKMAGTTAEPEVLGLLDTAPGHRPADTFTSAVTPSLS